MKKIALMAICAMMSNSLFSQQWDGATNSTNHIFRNGNVSIGTTQNLDKLNLGGTLRITQGDVAFGYHPPSGGPFGNTPNSDYRITFMPEENGTMPNVYSLPGALYFYPYIPDLMQFGSRQDFSVLVLGSNHKIGMGTDQFSCNSCTDYRLFVKDGIKTEKVKVEIAANNGWADYVFKKDYKLMPLKDLQSYIDLKGHLPEVPTTEEAIANGIELKEMNILLLKKIEELTLYTLQQQKNIEELTLHTIEQKKRIEALENKSK